MSKKCEKSHSSFNLVQILTWSHCRTYTSHHTLFFTILGSFKSSGPVFSPHWIVSWLFFKHLCFKGEKKNIFWRKYKTCTCALAKNTITSPSSPLLCRSSTMWEAAATGSFPDESSRYNVSTLFIARGFLSSSTSCPSSWSLVGGSASWLSRERWGTDGPRKEERRGASVGWVRRTTLKLSGLCRQTSHSSPNNTSVGTVRSWSSSNTTTPYWCSRGSDIISSSKRVSLTNLGRGKRNKSWRKRQYPNPTEISSQES